MRAHSTHAFFVCALLLSAAGSALAQPAQAPELPTPSPKARVEQRVGLTDVAVDYSSPAVKGRAIWGALVPYDALWRSGANAATRLSSSRDFTFAGKPVPAGSYVLYTIPGKTNWTVVLDKSPEPNWKGTYDAKTEVARGTVKPVKLVKPRERLAYVFSETTDTSTRLDLEWERTRVSIPLTFDTTAQAAANIEAAVADAWRPHFASGRYLFDNGGDLNKALEYLDASIAIKATWWNTWWRAQVLAKQGKTAEAVAAGEKAQALGAGDYVYENFFKAEANKAIDAWKKKK